MRVVTRRKPPSPAALPASQPGSAGFTTYRHHGDKCRSLSHRTWHTAAECLWPKAEWVRGDGPWACVSYCRVTCVTLWPTFQDAAEAKRGIDELACGGVCHGASGHRIICISEELR